MGVYLKDTASTWVPGPINVADELYNQTLPDLSTDPDVIAGGDTSVDEVDQRVGTSMGVIAVEIAGLKVRMSTVETGKSDVGHEHPINEITGLEARLASIEQRLTNAGF